MMFDTHLINMALAAIGISAAAAVLVAVVIIGVAALYLREQSTRGKKLSSVPTHTQAARAEREPQAA